MIQDLFYFSNSRILSMLRLRSSLEFRVRRMVVDLARLCAPPHRILVRRRRGLRGGWGKLLFSSLHSSVLVLPTFHMDKEGL